MKRTAILLTFILAFAGLTSAQEPGSIKLSGLMYADYFYNIKSSSAAQKDVNGLQFRRIYFTADYTVSPKFDARIRLESDQTKSSNTAGGRLGVMVKDAYIKWKNIFSGSDLYVGISPTPSFEVSEGAWGYRSLEKTILDFYGLVSSRDFGIDLKGRLNSTGSLKYWVKVANNSGNSPEQDKYKRFYGMVHYAPLNNLQLSVSADYAVFPKRLDFVDKQLKNNNAFTGAFMVNVMEKDLFSFAVEPVFNVQANDYYATSGAALSNRKSFGVSVFGWYAVSSLIRVAARYDSFRPDSEVGVVHDLVIGAVDFRIDKNLSIIPNVERAYYSGGAKKDLTGRVTLSFQF